MAQPVSGTALESLLPELLADPAPPEDVATPATPLAVPRMPADARAAAPRRMR